LGDRLFLGTADAHLLALDMRTGSVIWDAEVTTYKNGYSVTVAPLVVKDKVIIGVAGAEYGIRGFIDAYDVQTGKRAWRFYTVAGPDEPGGNTWPKGTDAYLRGGGSIWVTGSYDPEQNLVFFGTGNPGPDYLSSVREGDNLYTATSTTGIPHRCRFLPISRSTVSRARRCCLPTATGSSTCSIAPTAA
jgi:alcohol dehydrogenase (cytochrome c)